MCVIAVVPAGTTIPSFTLLKRAWDRNPHGAGFMYAVEGRLIVEKGLMSFTAFKAKFAHHLPRFSTLPATPGAGPVASVDLCVHFRIRSHGDLDAANTHPHFVPGHSNVAIAHNGIISKLPDHKTDSDTMQLARLMLRPLPVGWQRNPAILTLLEDFVGGSNKIVIFDKAGTCDILNKQRGTELNGVWWSNDYHLGAMHAPPKVVDAFADFAGSTVDGPRTTTATAVAAFSSATPKKSRSQILTICRAGFDPTDEVLHLIVDSHDGLGKCTMRVTLAEAMRMRIQLHNGEIESVCQMNGGLPFTAYLRTFYRAVKGKDLPPIGDPEEAACLAPLKS